MRSPLSRNEVVAQLQQLGVVPGSVVVVHSAFSRVGPIEGGPAGLIEALGDVLGPHGTLVMPSMSDDDEVPFEREKTPCRGMGIVAETFWRLPGVLRSDSPHSFAAVGPRAAEIVAPHPPEVPHGLDSPVGRVFEMDGYVLLLGVGHDGNTTVHLAEVLAGVRYYRPKHLTILDNGQPARLEYREIDHCCENFSLVDGWLEARGHQRRGTVGHGEARLMRSRAVVETAVAQLRADETVFLHPQGVDEECDEARASLKRPFRPVVVRSP
jgi:aminoglycoside N3'-acetyltransferase